MRPNWEFFWSSPLEPDSEPIRGITVDEFMRRVARSPAAPAVWSPTAADVRLLAELGIAADPTDADR